LLSKDTGNLLMRGLTYTLGGHGPYPRYLYVSTHNDSGEYF